MQRASSFSTRSLWVVLALCVVAIFATGWLAGCSASPSLVPDTTVVVDSSRAGVAATVADPVAQAQIVATVAMVSMGEAYRTLSKAKRTSGTGDDWLALAFSGTALTVEKANLRDMARSRSSLAATPGDPVLTVVAVDEQRAGCRVIRAVFDDRPLLAFPTSAAGVNVMLRLERTDRWRIAILAAQVKVGVRPLTCVE